jgi:hypothetical protein
MISSSNDRLFGEAQWVMSGNVLSRTVSVLGIVLTNLILFTGSVNAQIELQHRRYLIDFGAGTSPTNFSGWNNMTNPATGARLLQMIDTKGNRTQLSLQILKDSFNGYGGQSGGTNSEGHQGVALEYPASACEDSFFSYQDGGTMELYNLDTTRFYTIKIFASRQAADDRVGTYLIDGKLYTLNAANNITKTITAHLVRPSVLGSIPITFGVAKGSTFGYINVMEISEASYPDADIPTLQAAFNEKEVSLTWTKPENPVNGYVIERRLHHEDQYQVLAKVSSGITKFVDHKISRGSTYTYRVAAITKLGQSPYSREAVIRCDDLRASRRFLIDLGSPTHTTTLPGWNNLRNSSAGIRLPLQTQTGKLSDVSIQVVKAPHNNYGGAGNQFNTQGYDGVILDYPASACVDSHYAYGSGGRYRLTGLDTARHYNITLLASRWEESNDKHTVFSINGTQKMVNASMNKTKTVTFYDVKPSADGVITLDFGVAPGSMFGYLNVIDIVELGASRQGQ